MRRVQTLTDQVAYEYISSQVEKHGSMILSEFAGAAQSLNGSLLINPCKLIRHVSGKQRDQLTSRGRSINGRCHPSRLDPARRATKEQLGEALRCESTCPLRRTSELTMQYVSKYTAEAWGVSFVNERKPNSLVSYRKC
jgi:trehalose 6-phosphate synthase